MAASYMPTEQEIEKFDRDLKKYAAYVDGEGGDFTANDLRVLAQSHWPDKNVRVRAPSLGVDWIDSQPATAAPAAGSGEPAASPSSPEPLPPGRYVRPTHPAVQAKRQQVMADYGGQPSTVIRQSADEADAEGVIFRPGGEIVRGGATLDAQAQAELAALPAYGEPGWAAKQASRAILEAAAARATVGAEAKVQRRADMEKAVREAVADRQVGWKVLRQEAAKRQRS
jgi:hypothetical protein